MTFSEEISSPNSPIDATVARRHFWLLMLVALLVLGAGLGLRDPWPSDEPRFALVAKQMVESGDWLFPRRGVDLYSDKPPMLFWLQAFAYSLIGNWRIAFLLPSLVAALGTIALTYDLSRRLWNPRFGLYAGVAVLCAFQFMYQMKRAQIDPLITLLITLANYGLLLHFLKGPNWRAYWMGCFAAGLGVITKGVGVIALLMFLPYVFARVRGWEVARPEPSLGRWLLGPALFFAAIAIWLVPMVLAVMARNTPEYTTYMNDILFRQTAKRYAESWSHAQPFWYYGPILLFNWFPLSLAYIGAFPRWVRDLKLRDARIMLPLAWTALIVVFFSIPTGKRDVYILPALPMVALALAPYLEELLRARWLRNVAFWITAVGGTVIVAAGIVALLGKVEKANLMANERELAEGGRWLWWMVIAIGTGFVASAAAFRPSRGVHALLAGIATLWVIYGFWAHPVLNDSNSAALVMRKAGMSIGPTAELGLVAWKEQNMLMADRKVTDFGFKRPHKVQFAAANTWLESAPEKRWIFILEAAMGECIDRTRAHPIGYANRREWWIYQRDAVIPGCVPT